MFYILLRDVLGGCWFLDDNWRRSRDIAEARLFSTLKEARNASGFSHGAVINDVGVIHVLKLGGNVTPWDVPFEGL